MVKFTRSISALNSLTFSMSSVLRAKAKFMKKLSQEATASPEECREEGRKQWAEIATSTKPKLHIAGFDFSELAKLSLEEERSQAEESSVYHVNTVETCFRHVNCVETCFHRVNCVETRFNHVNCVETSFHHVNCVEQVVHS